MANSNSAIWGLGTQICAESGKSVVWKLGQVGAHGKIRRGEAM